MKRLIFVVLGVLALCLALGWTGLRVSRLTVFQLFGTLVTHAETDAPMVALSFDDGPTPWAHEVAQVLAAHDVRASFFVTGREAASNPGALAALIDGGHEIGNHSFTHPRLIFRPMSRVAREIEDTDAVIRGAGYAGPILFRPPYGKKLVVLPLYLARHDRASVLWSQAPESDPTPTHDAAEIARRTVEGARPGDIILLHAMYESRAATRSALPSILAGLKAKGFRIVTVSQLLAHSGAG